MQVEQNDPIKIFTGRVDVMMHDNYCLPRSTHLLQEAYNGLFCTDIHPGKRFIHKVNICFLCKGTSKEHALLLTAGQFTYLAVSICCHIYFFQASHCQGYFFFAGTPEKAELMVGSHYDHIQCGCGKVPIHRFPLRNIAYTLSYLIKVLVKKLHVATVKFQQAHYGFY